MTFSASSHVVFYNISVFCVSVYRFPCTVYLMRMGENMFSLLLTGRCYVCTNCTFMGLLWSFSIFVSTSFVQNDFHQNFPIWNFWWETSPSAASITKRNSVLMDKHCSQAYMHAWTSESKLAPAHTTTTVLLNGVVVNRALLNMWHSKVCCII